MLWHAYCMLWYVLTRIGMCVYPHTPHVCRKVLQWCDLMRCVQCHVMSCMSWFFLLGLRRIYQISRVWSWCPNFLFLGSCFCFQDLEGAETEEDFAKNLVTLATFLAATFDMAVTLYLIGRLSGSLMPSLPSMPSISASVPEFYCVCGHAVSHAAYELPYWHFEFDSFELRHVETFHCQVCASSVAGSERARHMKTACSMSEGCGHQWPSLKTSPLNSPT